MYAWKTSVFHFFKTFRNSQKFKKFYKFANNICGNNSCMDEISDQKYLKSTIYETNKDNKRYDLHQFFATFKN